LLSCRPINNFFSFHFQTLELGSSSRPGLIRKLELRRLRDDHDQLEEQQQTVEGEEPEPTERQRLARADEIGVAESQNGTETEKRGRRRRCRSQASL
jgi:hypothetical protein